MIRWIKLLTKETVREARKLVAVTFLTMLLTFLNLTNEIHLGEQSCSFLSIADILISSSHVIVYGFGYIPLLLFLVQNISKYDFYSEILIKARSRSSLWGYSCMKLVVFSAVCTLAILIINIFIGSFYVESFINWSERDSYYYSVVHITNQNVCFMQVALRYYFILVLRSMSIGMIFKVCTFLSGKNYLSWGLIICYICYSAFYTQSSGLFCSNMTVGYSYWSHITFENSYLGILITIAFLVIVYSYGYLHMREKDFLNENK